jgi:DNA-binding beta-propeller fold protein YncE
VKGGFDHFAMNLAHHRLFATAEDYHAVLVFDMATGTLVSEISGIGRPHAVLYREDLDRVFVTDGDAGALKIFDGSNYQPAGSIPLAKDADSIGYDASAQIPLHRERREGRGKRIFVDQHRRYDGGEEDRQAAN